MLKATSAQEHEQNQLHQPKEAKPKTYQLTQLQTQKALYFGVKVKTNHPKKSTILRSN